MSAKLTLDGTSAGAVKAVEQLNKALDATQKGAEGAVVPTKKLEAAAKALAAQADPQEKYNQKMKSLIEAVKGGGLAIEKAEVLAARYGKALDKVGESGKKAFDMSSIASVGRMGLEIMGISSALSLAVQGFKEFDAERRKAADDALRARIGIGQLSQLAASEKDPKQAFKNLVAESDSYLQMGAAADRNEAATLTFDLAAAGLQKSDRQFAARMRASGTLTNVGGMAQAYDALKTAMGEGEVGTFEQFVGKALKAGANAPGTVEQLPVALARAGSNARTLGLSDEFLLAAGSVLAKEAGSSSEGGTKLAALLGGIQKSGIDVKGLSGTEILDKFVAMPAEKTTFGGLFKENAEAVNAFGTLRANLDVVKAAEKDIFAAQKQGLAGVAVALPNEDASQRAANMRAQFEGG